MTEETRVNVCVTNAMHDFRSCTYKDAHTVNCDGLEYGWNEDHNREETTGRMCRGCRPRDARVGHLCLGCWERVTTAIADWGPFEALVDGVERAVQRDNGGVRGTSIGYVPIPGTLLAVEEIRSYWSSMGSSAEVWVETVKGAQDAVRFARSIASALRTHAVEEKAHHVKRVRCLECSQLTLVWNPTQKFGGSVVVKCSNPKCGAELDQAKFEKVAEIERPGVDGVTVIPDGDWIPGEKTEEPFDPTNPDHRELIA